MDISPILYKELKETIISQSREIECLKLKIHFMEQDAQKQAETIRKQERIIDALL